MFTIKRSVIGDPHTPAYNEVSSIRFQPENKKSVVIGQHLLLFLQSDISIQLHFSTAKGGINTWTQDGTLDFVFTVQIQRI